MDYESYTLQSYDISTSDLASANFLYLYSNGTYEIVNDTDFVESNYNTLELLMGYTANYSNRVLVGNATKSLVSVGYKVFSNDFIFMNTRNLDFMAYGSTHGGSLLVAETFEEGDSFDDLTSINNYYQYGSRTAIADFLGEDNNYGYFRVENFQNYVVFDYSNLKYDNLNDSYYIVRGENTTFHLVVNEFYYPSNASSIHLYYGAPYYSQYQQGYQNGFSNGFQDGWVQGNDNGYILGQNSNGNINQSTASAFDYIGQAFGAINSIMQLEVLPNITLGVAFTIPMVFVLIMTIFKLVRK